MLPVAGLRISPSLVLERELGVGGMGRVWLAHHEGLSTRVVVKLLSERLSDDLDARARFSREASASATIKSPHVVQVFDTGVTEDGTPYITMEHLEGEDLAARVRAGPLPPSDVATIVTQVCAALARAHDRGIVHRDIKPHNVFLCRSPTEGDPIVVKVLDFGIAKTLGKLTAESVTGALLGTPWYMSPEQLRDAKSVDHRADLWSVGVVAYQALTGKRPFRAENIGDLVMQILSQNAPPPSSVRPDLPPAVDRWFAKACAREPEDRFSSALELAEAFAAAVSTAGDRDGVTHSPLVRDGTVDAATLVRERTVPRSKRRLLAGGVAFVLLAASAIALSQRPESSTAAPADSIAPTPTPSTMASPTPSLSSSVSATPSPMATAHPVKKAVETVAPKKVTTKPATPPPAVTAEPSPKGKTKFKDIE